MEPQKNLCAMIPLPLHTKVREEQEKTGQSLSAYITQLLTDYYEREEKSMEFTKTLAFTVPEELNNRIKDHLDREKQRTGKRLTLRSFVIGLIERELEEAEQRETAELEEDGHADME